MSFQFAYVHVYINKAVFRFRMRIRIGCTASRGFEDGSWVQKGFPQSNFRIFRTNVFNLTDKILCLKNWDVFSASHVP
jgi:hypothetical protein